MDLQVGPGVKDVYALRRAPNPVEIVDSATLAE